MKLPRLLNRLLIGALKLETLAMDVIDLPLGTSIIALGRKPRSH